MTDWLVEWEESTIQEQILKEITDFLQTKEQIQQALDALNAGQPITEILSDLALVTSNNQTHLFNDWFGPDRWWAQDPAPVIAEGFKQALTTAVEPPVAPAGGADFLPVDCYWVARGSADSPISVAHSWNERQVTVVIFTPPAGQPSMPPGSTVLDQPIKVTQVVDNAVVTAQLTYRITQNAQ